MKLSKMNFCSLKPVIFYTIFVGCPAVFAQWPPKPTPNDTLNSVVINAENKVLFSIFAPDANKVLLSSSDIPNMMMGAKMQKAENGVWSVEIGPIAPGSYRYNFNVDGVSVIDPRNPLTSQSNMNTWSIFHINGHDFMDTQKVPHGAVAEVTYFSKSLDRFRRMHVYTPPGYEAGDKKYPVFYLLHGALDCDDSWSTVGRAGFILDNLIAEKKAKPMVVVMPFGHTGAFRFGQRDDSFNKQMQEFETDFIQDIMPYIEKHYRTKNDRANRAIAGLSMGGAHTLDIAIPNLEKFSAFGVYSSGVLGITGGFGNQAPDTSWVDKNKDYLDDADLKKGLKLVWFSTGKDDFLIETSRATVKMLKEHGFDVVFKESEGGHTWTNWREYLHEFAPLLFD